MSRVKTFLASSLLFLVLASCNRTPTGPEPTPRAISMEILRNIEIKQIDYDTISVRSSPELILPAQLVSKIGAGTGNSSVYKELVSVFPMYDGTEGRYVLKFQFTMVLEAATMTMPFVLRYYRTDGTSSDVEIQLPTYKYPYASAVPYLTTSALPQYADYFQDVDRDPNHVYIHPLAAFGLYEYDLTSRQTKLLVLYGAGDHIAVSGDFVFYDYGGQSVRRYNLVSRTTDMTLFQFSSGYPNDILGLAASEGFIYTMIAQDGKTSVLKYAPDGTLLESIPYTRKVFYLAVRNNILYSIDYASNEVVRFDLQSRLFLPSRLAPAKDGDGIKIYMNQFYYVDFHKRFVGMIPIEDIE